MKRTVSLFILSFVFLFSACEIAENDTENPDPIDENSDVEKMEIAGVYEMSYGPHALAVVGNYVYAARDNQIFVVNISDPANPMLENTITDLEANNAFKALHISGNILFAGCTESSSIYMLDVSNPADASIIGTFNDDIYEQVKLKPMAFFYKNGMLWASGSNGQAGMLVQFSENSADLTPQSYFLLSGTGNAAEGVWANSENVFISTADGNVYAFDSGDIAAGILSEYTFSNEAGHEHWGRTLLGNGNHLYWADWGAGFITLDISNPADLKSAALLTHSSFISQHPNAEGTNVYDLLLHNETGNIYLANGWSGLVEIDPASPADVLAFVDYKDNNYYCIEQYKNYVLLGDIAAGTTDVAGIKIIKVK
jgi:hypothetical protein